MAQFPRGRSQFALVAIGIGTIGGLALAELAFQAYARLAIFPAWDAVMADERHFYRHAEGGLAYELRPNTHIQHEGHVLQINAHGIRDESDDLFVHQRRIAVLGDSVVFGFGFDQDETISGRMQQMLDPEVAHTKVFNVGIGGLEFSEIAELLRRKDAIYDFDEVAFLANPNDFARRESIYEGADNGLYRMHRRPLWMTRWFVRKAIYRYEKRGKVSLNWYEWMFRGNEQWGYDQIRAMRDYARASDIVFGIVLLPSAYAFSPEGYQLADIHAKLGAFLEAESIPQLDAVARFQAGAARFYDDTDHFHDEGNVEMAHTLIELLEHARAASAPRPTQR